MRYGVNFRLKVGVFYEIYGSDTRPPKVYKFVRSTRKGFNFERPDGSFMSKSHYYAKKWSHKNIPPQQKWFNVELSNWITKVVESEIQEFAPVIRKITMKQKIASNLKENMNFETSFAGFEV